MLELLAHPTSLYRFFFVKLDAGLREVRFMKLIGKEEIPEEAQELFDRSDQLWQFTFNLGLTIGWYEVLSNLLQLSSITLR